LKIGVVIQDYGDTVRENAYLSERKCLPQ